MTPRLLIRSGLVEVGLVLLAIALLPASSSPDPTTPADAGADWHSGNTTQGENGPDGEPWPSPAWLEQAP